MADPFQLRRNVLTSVIAFVANILLVFLSYRLILREGGVAAIGLWSNLMAWIFIIRLGDVGMANAAVRFAARLDAAHEPHEIRRRIDTAFLLNGALFLALSGIGWVVYARNLSLIVPGTAQDLETARRILPLMFAGFLLQNLAGLALGALRAVHLGYVAAWIGIAGTLAQLLVVVPLVSRIGLAALAVGQIAQYALMLLAGWIWFLAGLRKISGWSGPLVPSLGSGQILREMMTFSLKAQVANLLNGLFEPVVKILIGRFGTLEVLGLFEMVYKLIALPRNAVISGVQASAPAMTRLMASDMDGARQLYRRSLRHSLWMTAAVLGLAVAASPVVSWLWFGAVMPPFSLFAALLGAGFLVNTLGASAFVLGMASGRMRGNIESAVVAIGVAVACIGACGFFGLATGMVAGAALGLAAGGLYVWRANKRLLGEGAP